MGADPQKILTSVFPSSSNFLIFDDFARRLYHRSALSSPTDGSLKILPSSLRRSPLTTRLPLGGSSFSVVLLSFWVHVARP